MSKEKTRDLLLEAGKKTFLEKGYNNSGIESILQAAGVPKGSFYYYFESKEDFGLKVLDRFAECYRRAIWTGPWATPRCPRWTGSGTISRRSSRQSGVRPVPQGCLVGNLSQEMADQSEAFRARLEEIFESWVDRYAECLKEAQEAGEICARPRRPRAGRVLAQ